MEATDRQATAKSAGAEQAAELARRVVDTAADKKASDIMLLDIRPVSYLADYFVICTGESERQMKAIGDAVIDALRDAGLRPRRAEGADASGWVLLDFGDIVVHIFSPEMRSFYRLEKVWSEAALVLHVL